MPYLVPSAFRHCLDFSRGTGERLLRWAGIRRVGRLVDSAFLRENKVRPAFISLHISVLYIWNWTELVLSFPHVFGYIRDWNFSTADLLYET